MIDAYHPRNGGFHPKIGYLKNSSIEEPAFFPGKNHPAIGINLFQHQSSALGTARTICLKKVRAFESAEDLFTNWRLSGNLMGYDMYILYMYGN